MKKFLFLILFIFSLSSLSYADDNTWITVGYSYYLPEETGATAPLGPANLTVGGQIMDWVAMFDVLPYLGIGPHVAANNTDFANNIFSYGFSAKVGVRFIEDGLLFGVGVEYLYNHVDADHNGVKERFNASGIAFGAEIGTVF